jgi:hypothetical protein
MFLLQYDPYSQTAEVRNLRSDGTATGFGDIKATHADELRRLEKDIILQNRMEALIEVLQKISESAKVDIRFVGTDKDFRDFENGVKRLKEQEKLDSESKLEKAESPFFHEPDYIRKQLREIAEDVSLSVEHLKEEYPETSNNLQFDDAEFKDVLNERTPLVFVGSGSHGKSSVINALIGAEVLQTGNGTTTEAVYEIIPDEKTIRVVFLVNDNWFELDFNGSKEEAEQQLNTVFRDEEISLMTNSPYDWVYQAVVLINRLRGVSKVSIHVPFKNLKSISNQVVIYDTPGPDSMTRTGHKGLLNDALGKFKKGVVIFVSTPTAIEKETLRGFLKTFTDKAEQLKSVLNVNAGIIVINKSDTSPISSINDGKESRKKHLAETSDSDTKQDFQDEEDRIIYFASPYPIGIHKALGDIWMDSQLEELFVTDSSKVCDYVIDPEKKKFYRPLATLAELPPLRKAWIVKAYEEAERRFVSNQSEENRIELIAHNSGLRALEYEIKFVVNELSICNLCAQGQMRLEIVLSKATDCLVGIRQNIGILEEDKRNEFNRIYGTILDKLFGEDGSVLSDEKKAVKEHVEKSITDKAEEGEAIRHALRKIENDIKSDISWDKIWKKRDKEITEQVAKTIVEATKEIQDKRNADAKKYYQDRFVVFKKRCQDEINKEESLSEEEKLHFLKDWEAIEIRNADVTIDENELRKTILFIFKLPDPAKARKEAVKKAERQIYNHKLKAWSHVIKLFEESCENARMKLYTQEWITSKHPRLRELSVEVERLTKQSEEYEELLAKVEKNLEIVRSLTMRKEKGKQQNEN